MAIRLRRLKIERFRDLHPGTELFFSDGWNVLLGRNGSGKTTLLHLISMVLRDDFSALREEEFELSYEMEFVGTGLVTVSLRNESHPGARQRSGFRTTTTVTTQEASGEPEARSFVDGAPTVAGKLALPWSNPLSGGRRNASLASLLDRRLSSQPASRLETMMVDNSLADCFRLDEGLATFLALTGDQAQRGPSVPVRCEATLVQDGTQGIIASPGAGGFVPGSIRKRMAALADWSRPGLEFEPGGEPPWETLTRLLGAARLVITARDTDSPVTNDQTRRLGRFEFHAPFAGDQLVLHDRWSPGQQRLLTLFWYLACNPDVLVADEPANGLHQEWIEALVEAIADRQMFVTAQNPLLLEHVSLDSPAKVERSFVLCRREAREDAHQMVWAQPTPEQAESFYRAWKTGVQPVHEVLRTEGLC